MNQIDDRFEDQIRLTKLLTRVSRASGNERERLKDMLEVGVIAYQNKYDQAWAPNYYNEGLK